ncbi:MAG: putative nucleic acid-binding Zn-ribbon protein, partial [Chlamydiales bacterium]
FDAIASVLFATEVISLINSSIENIQSSFENLGNRVSDTRSTLQEVESRLEIIEKRNVNVTTLENTTHALSEQFQTLNETVHSNHELIEKTQGDINHFQSSIDSNTLSIDSVHNITTQLNQCLFSLRTNISEIQTAMSEQQSTVNKLIWEYSKHSHNDSTSYNLTALQNTVSALNKSYNETTASLGTLKDTLENVLRNFTSQTIELENTKQSLQNTESRITELEEQEAKNTNEKASLEDEVNSQRLLVYGMLGRLGGAAALYQLGKCCANRLSKSKRSEIYREITRQCNYLKTTIREDSSEPVKKRLCNALVRLIDKSSRYVNEERNLNSFNKLERALKSLEKNIEISNFHFKFLHLQRTKIEGQRLSTKAREYLEFGLNQIEDVLTEKLSKGNNREDTHIYTLSQ